MAMLIGMMMAAAGVALLNKMLKGSIWPSANTKRCSGSKDQIIEVYDYEIVDDVQDRTYEGYKVKIHD
jgi:hypothetical protein